MKGQVDTYKEEKVYTFPNGVVRVRIPDLTEAERQRRRKNLAKAAEALMKEWKK